MSDSLQLPGTVHSRLFCPPLSPRVCLNSCPLTQWCNLIISSSAIPFSFCLLQSFPASGPFPISHLFASCGQHIGASASALVLLINIQGWFPLGSAGLISWHSEELSRVFSSTTVWKHQFFGAQLSLWTSSHIYYYMMWLLYMATAKTMLLSCSVLSNVLQPHGL